VKNSKANCSVAPANRQPCHKARAHAHATSSRTSRLPVKPACSSETLSKLKTHEKPSRPLTLPRLAAEAIPAQSQRSREHLERPHRQPLRTPQTTAPPHTSTTMQPTLPQQVRDHPHPRKTASGFLALTQSSRTSTASSPRATTASSSGAPASRTSRSRASTVLGMHAPLKQSKIRLRNTIPRPSAKADPNSYNIPKLKLGQYTPSALLRM
jgi:hypothetical protein